ncbi:hypothetical protein [Altibacter sp.]|uniref:hypothetical protein n=1 Tax=Altibacter sp. TaxID=2024823 RepID=UPI0025BFBC03|nr:hypothetical protein [Altibacter sp.]
MVLVAFSSCRETTEEKAEDAVEEVTTTEVMETPAAETAEATETAVETTTEVTDSVATEKVEIK